MADNIANSVAEVVAGEMRARDFNDALAIASVIDNRAKSLGVSYFDVVSLNSEFNAYGQSLPPGARRANMDMALRALQEVATRGPIHDAMFYATPKAIGNLPPGLQLVGRTKGHFYFVDPQQRAIFTAKGLKEPDPQARQMAARNMKPDRVPVPSPAPRAAATAYTAPPEQKQSPAAAAIEAVSPSVSAVAADPSVKDTPTWDGTYTSPFDATEPDRVTSAFGARSAPRGLGGIIGSRNHKGVDMSAGPGRRGYSAVSVAPGTVTRAQVNHPGFGNVVEVTHPDGMKSRYGHLDAINVSMGDKVAQGARVGAVGNTGRSIAPHLHFEMMNPAGQRINPMDVLTLDRNKNLPTPSPAPREVVNAPQEPTRVAAPGKVETAPLGPAAPAATQLDQLSVVGTNIPGSISPAAATSVVSPSTPATISPATPSTLSPVSPSAISPTPKGFDPARFGNPQKTGRVAQDVQKAGRVGVAPAAFDEARFGPSVAPSIDAARFASPAPLGVEFSPSLSAAMAAATAPANPAGAITDIGKLDITKGLAFASQPTLDQVMATTPASALEDGVKSAPAATQPATAPALDQPVDVKTYEVVDLSPVDEEFDLEVAPAAAPAPSMAATPSVNSYAPAPSVNPGFNSFGQELSQQGRTFAQQEMELQSLLDTGQRNRNIGRIAGGTIGSLLGGPVGAVLGAMLGSRMAPDPAENFYPDAPMAPANRKAGYTGKMDKSLRDALSDPDSQASQAARGELGPGLY